MNEDHDYVPRPTDDENESKRTSKEVNLERVRELRERLKGE